jgi:hypothetical protein
MFFSPRRKHLCVCFEDAATHPRGSDFLSGLHNEGFNPVPFHDLKTPVISLSSLSTLFCTLPPGANIHAFASETLQPVLEVLTFRLGELRGLARWKARLGPIGVNEPALEEALEYSGQMMVHTERLMRKTATLCGEVSQFTFPI